MANSDYGRRAQAFQDIFARPVGPPIERRTSPHQPSSHQLQMTPAHTDAGYYGGPQQPGPGPPPPMADRRTSVMSSNSSHYGGSYYAPPQPVYTSMAQAGPSRMSYAPPSGPMMPPPGAGPPLWATQPPPGGYYGQPPLPPPPLPPQSGSYYQPGTNERSPTGSSQQSAVSSPRGPRTSTYSTRRSSNGHPVSMSADGHGQRSGGSPIGPPVVALPSMRTGSNDFAHDPQLSAFLQQPGIGAAVSRSSDEHHRATPPSRGPSAEPDGSSREDWADTSPTGERSDSQHAPDWDNFAGAGQAAYYDDAQQYAATMAQGRRGSGDSANSFFGDRSDQRHYQPSLRQSFSSMRHPEGPRPPPGYPSRNSGSLHSVPSYRSSPWDPYGQAQQQPFDMQYANGYVQGPHGELQARKSIESVRSVRVLPTQPKALPAGYQDRAMTMSGLERPDMAMMRPPSTMPPGPPAAMITHSRRAPIVYPALLSRVAEAFKLRVMLSERVKDGLSYKDAFDGRDAVDKLAYIIKTTDRNLALLLGRALDAQKFFHDATYEHRLRDSPYEIYQFRERTGAFIGGEDVEGADPFYGQARMSGAPHGQPMGPPVPARPPSVTDTMLSDESSAPSGVFTLLTDCYSPTCTRDRLCYSIACPRRLEQQARLKLKPQPGLKRSTSNDTYDDVLTLREPGALWSESVPKEVLEKTSDTEKKRQEAINEAVYTERDFVTDLEYLRDTWVKGLRASNVIPEARREDFITQVFWNVLDLLAVNTKLFADLNRRQAQAHVVDRIGDIYLEHVPMFQPFVQYGAHQLYGKYEFEKERSSNPAFAKFVDDLERAPESRKLELNGYLTKPTTRLARYPLLLEAVLKHTPDDHPDKLVLPRVIKLVRDFLTRVNEETGKSENRFTLAQLDQQLVFRPGEAVDLKLREENREMIFKGGLKKRGGAQSESAELQVFLFDHAILMVKQKTSKTQEQYKVYRKPIPLELLVVTTVDDPALAGRATASRPKSLMARASSTNKPTSNGTGTAAAPVLAAPPPSKQGYAMTLVHLGRKGYSITLWSPSWAGRKKWLEKIDSRQAELRERSLVFDAVRLSEGVFVGNNKVTCAAPFEHGERMVFGTDSGVYLADLRVDRKRAVPIKVIATPNVTQVDVLEDHGILVVLADKTVQTFFIDHLDSSDPVGQAKRARKIHTNASFFKTGQCLGRTLVCIVKSGAVSSTIKTMEPIEQHGRGGKKQPGIRKFLQGNPDSLKVFKEFYLPLSTDSVHFLKSKLCVGCVKGFEIVDLETLDTQGLLDPADSSLDFVQKRENVKPLAIFRIDGEFLLCYDEFAFYVNKNGWRARSNWLVQWEGHPTSFALRMPFILAFEPTFVEVRHVDTGALMQIMQGTNLRCLFSDTPPSSYSIPYPPMPGYGGPPYGMVPPGPPPGHPLHAQHQQQLARQASYAPYGVRPPPPPIVRRPSGSRSQIIMASDGGATVVRLEQTAP